MSTRTDAGPGVPADPFPQYDTEEEVESHIGGGGGSVATHEAAADPHPQYSTSAEVIAQILATEGSELGSRRSITFVFDGTNWIEESRT